MDRREQILARLAVILTAANLPNVITVARNRGELPKPMRPGVVVLDGAEEARQAVAQRRGRARLAPALIDMTPEISVAMDSREPHNEGIGEDMNALRIAIVKAIMADTQLADLLAGDGAILYNGCTTDMATGQSKEGTMLISMTFTYMLLPSEL